MNFGEMNFGHSEVGLCLNQKRDVRFREGHLQ
jgi:hypothetical protein